MTSSRRDYAFPLRIDGGSQQAAQAPYPAHVAQMVEQIVLTNVLERRDLPQFGSQIQIFAPINDALQATLQLQLTTAVQQWLAGVITVRSINVATSASDPGIPDGQVQVTVSYVLVATQTNDQTTVTLP